MPQHEASRTLVKSPPELWTECSDAASLARHLDGSFGEIRITRLEPETAVAWEGERVSGTVRIEPSGWGTRVTLTAVEPEPEAPEAVLEPEPQVPEAAPAARVSEPEPAARTPEPELEREPEPEPERAPEPEPVAEEPRLSLGPPPRLGFRARFRLLFGKSERAEPEAPKVAPAPEPQLSSPEPEPIPEPIPEPDLVEPEPTPGPELLVPGREPEPEPAVPEPATPDPEPALDTSKVLTAALESLGQAHHRPFSRG